jgi:hypothetical protein
MQRLIEHYKFPSSLVQLTWEAAAPSPPGYFRFGHDAICFGTCSGITPASSAADAMPEIPDGETPLPFVPDEIIDNLLMENYQSAKSGLAGKAVRALYYAVRPLLPVVIRKHFQRRALSGWADIPFPKWPVDCTVDRLMEKLLVRSMSQSGVDTVPFIWFWPEGQDGCAIVTHDVETETGRAFCPTLMDLNDSVGIKSSFQLVPQERYQLTEEFLNSIRDRGFEINVHDYNHDGNLFQSRSCFESRVGSVNEFARKLRTVGFRAGAMYRNQHWFRDLDFEFDLSVPNVAHLEPQRGGCCTVKPYFVGKVLELPLTVTQDYALFHFLSRYSTDLWLQQINEIRRHYGLITILVHPDYILEAREQGIYLQLLRHLDSLRKNENIWIATPNQLNQWWRVRNSLNLAQEGEMWRIVGDGSERARLAFARLCQGRLNYYVTESNCQSERSIESAASKPGWSHLPETVAQHIH